MPSCVLILLFASAAVYAEVNGIRLAGSAQPDCWSVEEIVQEVTAGAGSDREKALALHRFGMAHFIHFDGPIEERSEYVTDPMKLIAVYGYALCGNNSAAMNALYNAAGLKARRLSVPGHSVPEVWFENKWNYIDTDMFGYVFLPDGKIASVAELIKQPELFLQQKNPPDPYYPFDKKESMAGTFRNTRPSLDYHAYSNAHIMSLSLRAGETARLFFRPRGEGRFFLTPSFRPDLGTVYKDYYLVGPVRKDSLAWCDRPPASYGNGLLEYAPDLRAAGFLRENPGSVNVTQTRDRRRPPLATAAPGQLSQLVVKITTPWVIAGLQNDLTNFDDNTEGAVVSGLFWRTDQSDENRILVSRDNGHTWTKVWENRYLGAVPFRMDLTRLAEGEYGYWVKFEWLDRKGSGQAGLEGLKVNTWVELSPMALPRLAPGKNSFRISKASAAVFYNHSRWDRGQGLPGEQLENLAVANTAPFLRLTDPGRPGVLTFPAGPEGDIEELRVSLRARAARGSQGIAITLSLSEDGGATWRELERFAPHPEHTTNSMWFNYVVHSRTLNGGRTLVRAAITGGGLEQAIANSVLRAVPRAPGALRITQLWREGGRARTAAHVVAAGSRQDAWEVTTGPAIINEEVRLEALP